MASENCEQSTASLKENVPLRINNISSAEYLEKPSASVHESPNKKGFESHIPRTCLVASNSCNDTLKNDLGKCKGRPSMIPKSKAIKRTEKGNVKIELSVQSEEISAVGKSNKKHSMNKREAEAEAEEAKEIMTKKPEQTRSEEELKGEDARSSTCVAETEAKEEPKNLDTEISCTSMKSCVMESDLKELKGSVYSMTSVKSQVSEYRDAEEELNGCFVYREEYPEGESGNDEREAERQEKGIQLLYETLKSTGPLFDKFKWTCDKNHQDVLTEDGHYFSIQQCYDVTLEEISDIWKTTMSLISSVKEHAIKFVEEEKEETANCLDREQLILEGEVVQLAIDFAINFSKLKTDFLIKSASERLGVDNLTKSSLEDFMDSKTFAALYNDDDLATMSRTIKDLNTNVLKDADL